MSEEYVSMWRRRFECDRLAGLEDRPRSGRPRKYGHDERFKIVETVTSRRPEVDSQWSHRLIAEALADDVGISASQVGRILADLDLKPHRVRGWLTRPDDPDFWERAADVCGLYLHAPGQRGGAVHRREDRDRGPFRGAPDQARQPGRSNARSSSTAVTAPPV